jgi:hypothetical protein
LVSSQELLLTSKASPNDSEIVIVIIIVIGEAKLVMHIGGIIAQTVLLESHFLWFISSGGSQWGGLMLSGCKLCHGKNLSLAESSCIVISESRSFHFNKENKMNFCLMFLINALIAVLLGLGFLAIPNRVLGQFGVDEYAATKLASQFIGTAILALGLLLWFAKDVNEENLQKGMAIALLVGSAAGLVITLIGTTSGILRSNGWIAMVVYLLFGLAYAYLVFMKPMPEAS